MSPANHYKKTEKTIIRRVLAFLGVIFKAVGRFFAKVYQTGKQRFTIMLIPHSEKSIFNFRVSVFSLIFSGFLLGGVVVSFLLFSTRFSGLSRLVDQKETALEDSRSNIEAIREEITELKKVSKTFEASLKTTMSTFGVKGDVKAASVLDGGDLSSFFDVQEQSEGIGRELSELRSLREFLEQSSDDLLRVSDIMSSQGDLLVELPTLWPVEGGVGRITNYFGPEIHPFTGQWYLHKGIDIAFRRGKPIVAAANGKVVERKYDAMGFGNYVVIRHPYGFATKYAHMDTVYVEEGDVVTQGQKIGTMGNTGLSTGPHVHFEVRIGSQVVDPERFLNVKSDLR
ncbi:M23 family metallopeptidase [Sediminispirochaeta bajacaliforniensis]|uniref:M23 family metallopeptidase n=1 Tax=Sediminispirochaeta bajacaliforniensis TaxID=148 RepID=UPI0003615473|nr:M23 family metallopeptidase [Sediminispirochaeta bajacaliforniensis]